MSLKAELSARLTHEKLARLGAALLVNVDKNIKMADLSWALGLLGKEGDRLVWEVLKASGALGDDGFLRTKPLVWLLEDLLSINDPILEDCPRLVWTLPPEHPEAEVLGTSYTKAILEVIKSAEEDLLMTSPFLQEHGVASLMESLIKALGRGVKLIFLTHEADNIASSQSIAVDELRREAERLGRSFIVYTATTSVGSMLHAKLVVADGRKMVLGSANLTGPGLRQNIEAGVVLGEREASKIKMIIDGLITGGLIKLVFKK